jgi:hypothetical protein
MVGCRVLLLLLLLLHGRVRVKVVVGRDGTPDLSPPRPRTCGLAVADMCSTLAPLPHFETPAVVVPVKSVDPSRHIGVAALGHTVAVSRVVGEGKEDRVFAQDGSPWVDADGAIDLRREQQQVFLCDGDGGLCKRHANVLGRGKEAVWLEPNTSHVLSEPR